ncbi:hypothetical protein, unlikely [Trypanosoma brucei gambiense DAL972]|uniref:Uncharacterized protein n=1 Tax=Trypanosoma brucei gambiense (strain MHOM/CI/86/DAL972) TaxID=679716 RepID=C9ZJ30_TRYB9|nr:hypothetical protein, unlikely [Trypanosoma brucei gambiense DAL972]CBH09388.1 hypothetical protein, unlikely [Trypanosoma brucei gambiense DAL972]|eukprot:XP_011771694.1 hypothetical protein, unlikely [Trypanosoma brucei gambiense DAL972]
MQCDTGSMGGGKMCRCWGKVLAGGNHQKGCRASLCKYKYGVKCSFVYPPPLLYPCVACTCWRTSVLPFFSLTPFYFRVVGVFFFPFVINRVPFYFLSLRSLYYFFPHPAPLVVDCIPVRRPLFLQINGLFPPSLTRCATVTVT